MLKRLIGKQCVNSDCRRRGEMVAAGAVCEECGAILKPVMAWDRRAIATLALVLVAGGGAVWYWHGKSGAHNADPVSPVPVPIITGPKEITFSWAFEMPQDDRSISLVSADRVFRSGDRFRLVLKSDFKAYVDLFNENPDDTDVHVLYPVVTKAGTLESGEELRAPGAEGWFRMDTKIGNEVLILVVSPNPLPELQWRDRVVHRLEFDSWLAKIEEGARSPSQRTFRNAAWNSLMADASRTPLVLVQRVPLRHE